MTRRNFCIAEHHVDALAAAAASSGFSASEVLRRVIDGWRQPDTRLAAPEDAEVSVSVGLSGAHLNALLAYGAAHGVGVSASARMILDDWLSRSCGATKKTTREP